MMKGLMGLPGMGSASSLLGGLLDPGYAAGGFTGAGGKYDPAGIVHRGEYVMSAQAVQRLGVRNLDAIHQGALKGYANGGAVGVSSGGGGKQAVDVQVHVTNSFDNNGNLQTFVDKRVAGGVQQGIKQFSKGIPDMVHRSIRNPRDRW
jgi:phage-related minor tail protein